MFDCWPALIPVTMLIGACVLLLHAIRRQTYRHRAQVETIEASIDEVLVEAKALAHAVGYAAANRDYGS